MVEKSPQRANKLVRPHTVTRRRALHLAMLAGTAIALFPGVARAVTQAEIDAAKSNVDALQATLDQLSAEYQAALDALNATAAQIETVNSKINETQTQIDELQRQIDEKTEQIAQKRELLGKRMSSAYKSGPTGPIDVLLSSGSFEELVNNIYYLDRITQSDQDMIIEINNLKTQLEQQQADLKAQQESLKSQKAELESLQATQQEQLAVAQAKQDEATELLNQANSDLSELEAARAAEEAYIRQQQAAAIAAGNSGGGSYSGGSASSAVVGNGSLSAVINAAYATGGRGAGWCAAYVTDVFRNAGVGTFWGNACDMYYSWCWSSNLADLQPGMVIAVPTNTFGWAGRTYGHIGIYLGNGIVRHNEAGPITELNVNAWISRYNTIATPRWGWLGGIALS